MQTKHLDKSTFTGPFNALNTSEFKNYIPELLAALKEHGLYYEDANLYVMWNNQDALPHKDYTGATNQYTDIFSIGENANRIFEGGFSGGVYCR